MALPSLLKTWQHNVNQVIPVSGTNEDCVDKTWLAIVNSLIGFSLNPWTVVGSSNGTTANMTGTNLWTAVADLVHNFSGSAHSWIVLKQANVETNFQICIDLVSTTVYNNSVIVSHSAGFTGGSTTARPTATDEDSALTNVQCFPTTTFQSVVHAMQSTDGKCTRVLYHVNNVCLGFWLFDVLNNPVTNFALPHAAVALMATTSRPTRALLYSAVNTRWRFGSTNYTGYMTEEAVAGSALGTIFNSVANEISTEWPIDPVGFASNTVGVRGRHASFTDLWWGSAFHSEGTAYPADTTRQFAQFGEVVLPWNGTAPVIA